MLKEHNTIQNTIAPAPRTKATAMRVIIATLFPQFAFGLGFVWIGIAPYAMQQSHWSASVIEAIYALTPLSASLTFLVSGRLVTKVSPRTLSWLGVSLLAVGQTIAFLFPGELTFLIFYAVIALGVGYGLALVASLAAMAQTFPRRIGTAGGALSAAYGLAAVAEIPLISYLTLANSWITALRIAGSGVTVLAVIALLFMPAIPPSHEHARGGFLSLNLLKRSRVGTAVLLEILAVPLGSYALSQVGISAQDLRLVAAFGTATVMLAAITNTLGRFMSGLLSDHMNVNAVMLVIILLDAAGGFLLWRTTDAPLLLVASGMIGLACGGLSGAVPRLAQDAFPDAFNASSGLLYAAFALGSFTGPLLGSTFGGGKTAWFVLGSISATALIVLVLRLVEADHRPQRLEERANPPAHTQEARYKE